ISSAVATFVAIWQNASCGVRMLIACQLRLSTSTIVLFNMSFIKRLHTATDTVRCLSFIEMTDGGLNCQRQRSQAQISAANGINASAYLNLNVHLAVLCRNTIMPSKPPAQPPRAPSVVRNDSGTRPRDC